MSQLPELTSTRFRCQSQVFSIAFSPDGIWFACGLENGQVMLLDISGGTINFNNKVMFTECRRPVLRYFKPPALVHGGRRTRGVCCQGRSPLRGPLFTPLRTGERVKGKGEWGGDHLQGVQASPPYPPDTNEN